MIGCGGGQDNGSSSTPAAEVLHLRDYDISAADFRSYTRGVLLRPAGQSVCRYVQWLSNAEIVAELISTNPVLPAGGVGVAGQTPNPAEEDEASGIAKDECARITPPRLAFSVLEMQIVSPAFAWNLTDEHLIRWTPFPSGAAGAGLDLQDMAPPSISAADIKGVHFLDPNNGWLVANGATDATGATQLVAYRTSDGGKRWESFPFGTAKKLYAQTLSHTAYIDFVDLDKGWVVLDVTGTGGFDSDELWHTDDGGQSWTKLSTDVSAPVNFTSAQDGWASGRRATHDGGKSWDAGVDIVPICPPPGCELVMHGAPIRIDDGRLLDLASTLSVNDSVSLELDQSTDGGQTWTSLASSGSIAARPATVPATQVLPDGTVVAITADGTAGLHYDPETATFERFSVTGLDPLIDIDFLDKDRGLALVDRFGINDIEQTEDGGRTWARYAEGVNRAG